MDSVNNSLAYKMGRIILQISLNAEVTSITKAFWCFHIQDHIDEFGVGFHLLEILLF